MPMMSDGFRARLRSEQEHAEEHDRCEVLGEGPQVPVRCSCGERFGPTWEEFTAELEERS